MANGKGVLARVAAALTAAEADINHVEMLQESVQDAVDLPLIDSVQAGLKVLLEGRAPAPHRQADGFVADWSAVTPPMARLARPT